MRCGTAVFTVEGPTRRLPAQRTVGARAERAHPRRGWRRPRLDRAELARTAARTSPAAAGPRTGARRHGRQGDAQSRSRTGAHGTTAGRRSVARRVAQGVHQPAGLVRQAASDLRQNAVDHNAEAAPAPLLGTCRRRRWRPQLQPAATESDRRTTTSTSRPSTAPASHIPSGIRGRRPSCPTTSRSSSARTPTATGDR